MLSFAVDGVQFNFRAAAVIIDDGHVLLHRADYDTAWSLPGGRVDAGEPSAATVARELEEELGPAASGQIERLLWVVENFFSYEGMQVHELGMYYLVTLGASNPLLAKDRAHNGVETDLPFYEGRPVRLVFQWFPLDSLVDVALYPTFLRTSLSMLPTAVELVTHTDGEY